MGELLYATLRFWTPLTFAAMGGVVSERAGVVNIGLEAMMLGGAFGAVAGSAASGSAVVGILIGLLFGALLALLHAALTQALKVPHILSGVGLNLGVLGLTTYGLRLYPDATLESPQLLPAPVTIALAAVTVAVAWFVFARTSLGLRLRAIGENPNAARSAGIDVARLRYGAVTASGALAGFGGVALALSGLGAFTQNMTAGRGYIALAAVIFGRWTPLGAAGAALMFGFGTALQQMLQTAGLSEIIPPDFIDLLPYVLTLLALAFTPGRTTAPAALGNTN